MSEFYTIPDDKAQAGGKEVFHVGRAYATPLTGFLAGLIVGLLAMFILTSVIK